MFCRSRQSCLSGSILFASLITIVLLSGCATNHLHSQNVLAMQVDNTINQFSTQVAGGSAFLEKSEGILVFPSVIKAGVGLGGEYGEGILKVDGNVVDFYSTAAASFGFQFGAQRKSLVLVFLDKNALQNFRYSNGWKVGIDGSVAIAEWGVGEDINSMEMDAPVIAFMFNNEGLMYNLTLEGAKFTRLHSREFL